ncbi:hypothetical protein D3C71_1692650 [compost metagenome]
MVIIVIIRIFEPALESKFMDLSIRRFLAKWNDEIEEEEEEEEEEDLKKEEKFDREGNTNE